MGSHQIIFAPHLNVQLFVFFVVQMFGPVTLPLQEFYDAFGRIRIFHFQEWLGLCRAISFNLDFSEGLGISSTCSLLVLTGGGFLICLMAFSNAFYKTNLIY